MTTVNAPNHQMNAHGHVARTLDSEAQFGVVSVSSRYMGAWNEVNARITQRQNALNIFVTLATAVVSILFAARQVQAIIDPDLFALLLPIVSLVFGFLNYKHDKTIALLRSFMSACEEHGKQYLSSNLLGYNSDPFYRGEADKTRRFHDISSAALIVIFNLIGASVAHQAYPGVFQFTGWPIFVYVLLAIIAVGLVMRSTVVPYDFTNQRSTTSNP